MRANAGRSHDLRHEAEGEAAKIPQAMAAAMSQPFLRLQVRGIPVTQGSVRFFPGKGGKAGHSAHGNAEKLHPWRERVAAAAQEGMGFESGTRWHTLSGPVRLVLTFTFPPPKQSKMMRVAGQGPHMKLVPRPPSQPTTKHTGDLDRLVRAIGDALTGIVYLDDAQIVRFEVEKRYGPEPGVEIEVYEG